jgi:hypothetical protein
MDARKLWIAASAALLPMNATLADATSAGVAALKKDLGDAAGLEIDEVRVTSAGVTCIDYRLSDGKGGNSAGHAVVRGDEVLKSSSGGERFEKEWNQHCLGPRGGITGGVE